MATASARVGGGETIRHEGVFAHRGTTEKGFVGCQGAVLGVGDFAVNLQPSCFESEHSKNKLKFGSLFAEFS